MEGATDSTSVLVTGASGFIATHIIQQLQEEGFKVKGTVRSLEDEEKVKKLQELCPEAKYKLELVEADLAKPETWEPAVKDVTYVIHVASPFPMPSQIPKDENELISPAVDGTQAILKACVQAKSVKKVVMTSSSVAICYGQPEPNKTYTEEDWMDAEKLDGYGKSKVMAEKAAWDYIKELPDEDKIELAVIHPAYVMGPLLIGQPCTSLEISKRLLEKDMMLLPKLNFSVVDVRDVAAAHIKAMTTQEASGKRHIISNANMWLKDIAMILSKEFKSQGYSVPTSNCPTPMLKIYGLFDSNIKVIIPNCGKVVRLDNTRMKEVLGITPRELKDTIVDMAYSAIEAGLIKKSKKYKGPHAAEEQQAEEEKAAEDGKTDEEKKEEEEKAKENGEVKDSEKTGEEKKEEGKTEEGEEKKEEEKKEEEKDNKEAEKEEEKKEEEQQAEAEKTEEKTEEKAEEKTEEKTEEK